MDPLSFAASIVALTQAAKGAVVLCKKLNSLRHRSGAICALENEIVEVRLLVGRVETLLIAQGQLNDHAHELCRLQEANVAALTRHSETLRERLLSLEALTSQKLYGPRGEIRKLQWIFFQSTVEGLQQKLREAKLDMGSALAVLTSAGNMRLQVQLEDIQVVMEETERRSSTQFEANHQALLSAIAPAVEASTRYEQTYERMEAMFQRMGFAANIPSRPQTQDSNESRDAENMQVQQYLPQGDSSYSTVNIRLSATLPCAESCRCRCHRMHLYNTPAFLKKTLGILYGGYLSLPVLKPSCDKPSQCKGTGEHRLSVNYVFPQWLLSNALSLAIRLTPVGTPEFSLRIMRVRNKTDEIFRAAKDNQLEEMRQILLSRRGSPIDITSDDGHTPLHIAVQRKQTRMVRLLLQHHAEPHIANYHQETPYEIAWDDILATQGISNLTQSNPAAGSLLECFPNAEVSQERREFTIIHKIVLKLVPRDLEQELKLDRSAIDVTDADGRTPLYWACQRGDIEATSVLLKYGADTEKTDHLGQGPLRASIKNTADGSDCLQALLKYGANPDIRDKWEQTCLIAATYYPRPTLFIPHLLQAGADVNAREDHGATALWYAAHGPDTNFFGQNVHPFQEHKRAAELLLAAGADVNVQDREGISVLHHHIAESSHLTVALLLQQRNLDPRLRAKDGRTALHVAAAHADARTLDALAAARCYALHAETLCEDAQHRSFLAVAAARRPHEDADWHRAWDAFVDSLRRPTPLETALCCVPCEPELTDESDASWCTAADEWVLDLPARLLSRPASRPVSLPGSRSVSRAVSRVGSAERLFALTRPVARVAEIVG